MIHIFSSVSVKYSRINSVAYSELLRLERDDVDIRKFQVISPERDTPHLFQADQAERLIRFSNAGTYVVCPTDMELVILRLCRRVREGTLLSSSLRFTVLDCKEKQHCLYVNSEGEFAQFWPEGFFDARSKELF